MTGHEIRPQQDSTTAARNEAFFADNSAYTQRVATLDTYRFIREQLDVEVRGAQRLLDIGQGGTFDYDPALAGSITAVDLFVEPGAEQPPNVTYLQGDALALPVDDGGYDTAVMVMLFHHLVGASAADLTANVTKSLAEAHRALASGGRLIVVESCVPEWFYAFERAAFPALLAISKRGVMEHPATLQLPPKMIADLIRQQFGALERADPINVGRIILQFGRRWPRALTPARPWIFTARR